MTCPLLPAGLHGDDGHAHGSREGVLQQRRGRRTPAPCRLSPYAPYQLCREIDMIDLSRRVDVECDWYTLHNGQLNYRIIHSQMPQNAVAVREMTKVLLSLSSHKV